MGLVCHKVKKKEVPTWKKGGGNEGEQGESKRKKRTRLK